VVDALEAMLSILSGQGTPGGMEQFAKRNPQTLNELLGTEFGRTPPDSTFHLLLAQLDVPGFEIPMTNWLGANPSGAEELETLVSDARRCGTPCPRSVPAQSLVQASLY
jgi:hypothetical protein